ncbi:MAG: nucleoside monophosphate kinase [Clostridiales bacterium]|jgi:adenylate kinase|nr:nucleoside monophosphate kinase [Clostridiales bacterium]
MHGEGLILGKWNFIFLLGESGGGKGTLVKNIKDFWMPGLKCTSMGDIFREKSKTDETIKTLTEQGVLIDDDITMAIFQEFALANTPGLIDGFPRKRSQVLQAIKFIKEEGWRVLVLDLKCDIEVIIERLLARGRADDRLDIMYKRNLDHRTLHPKVIKEIRTRPDLFDIVTLDGNKSSDYVFTEFLISLLREVELLYLYDLKDFSANFSVMQSETTVDNALNRGLSEMLIKIQKAINESDL